MVICDGDGVHRDEQTRQGEVWRGIIYNKLRYYLNSHGSVQFVNISPKLSYESLELYFCGCSLRLLRELVPKTNTPMVGAV